MLDIVRARFFHGELKKIRANEGPSGLPIETPSICKYVSLLKMKQVSAQANVRRERKSGSVKPMWIVQF